MKSASAARAASGSLASTSGAGAAYPAASAPAWAAELRARFPCRDAQIDELIEHVADCRACTQPRIICGPPATGKTALARALLRAAGLRHAYVSCVEATASRVLLSSVLAQLRGGKRMREDGYAAGVKCESIADFRLMLPDACRAAAASMRRAAAAAACSCGDNAPAAAAAAGEAPPCWILVDHAERLADSELLAALLRVLDDADAGVGLLLISSLPHPDGGFTGMGTADGRAMVQIDFPGYSAAQLMQIMEARHRRLHAGRDEAVFRQFLRLFLPAFWRASSNLQDLQAAVDRLFPAYCAPLRQGQALQAQALYGRIKGQVAAMIRDLDFRGGSKAAAAGAAVPGAGEEDAAGAGEAGTSAAAAALLEADHQSSRASHRGLSYELPFVSKFLLLAAYVASRNKPATDRQIFDPTFRKRQRANAQRMDRQAEAALDAKLRGPHAFPLERLLHIFFYLYKEHAEDDDVDVAAMREDMLAGEVLMQVSSLVSLRQLSLGPGDPLEGASYRCNLTEQAAHAIAGNLKVPLGDYLKLA